MTITTLDALESNLSTPTPGVIDTLRNIPGDIILLGVGGKMGPTLARMLRRASLESDGTNPRRIIGVSRFSSPHLPDHLRQQQIEPISADLLNRDQVNALPDCPNVISMAGMKFGATGNEPLTWAMNALLPAIVCEKFRRSRIVAFSTGNVYGLVPAASGGSRETDKPNPVGEYAMSCLGRERMYQYFSQAYGIPLALLRLNYAVELRYGVLLDIARKVHTGQPIDLSMGHVNVIWQADANAHSIQALARAASPATILNIAGPDILRVRDVASRFGRLLNKEPRFTGHESPDALLNNASQTHQLFGPLQTPIDKALRWTADWLLRNGATLDKPTHFESRDGKF